MRVVAGKAGCVHPYLSMPPIFPVIMTGDTEVRDLLEQHPRKSP
jgi:hypothetical protein